MNGQSGLARRQGNTRFADFKIRREPFQNDDVERLLGPERALLTAIPYPSVVAPIFHVAQPYTKFAL